MFESKSYSPDRARELVRGDVTVLSIMAFLGVAFFYLVFAARSTGAGATDTPWAHVKEAMGVILSAVTSVLGTVLGFYFGSQKS